MTYLQRIAPPVDDMALADEQRMLDDWFAASSGRAAPSSGGSAVS